MKTLFVYYKDRAQPSTEYRTPLGFTIANGCLQFGLETGDNVYIPLGGILQFVEGERSQSPQVVAASNPLDEKSTKTSEYINAVPADMSKAGSGNNLTGKCSSFIPTKNQVDLALKIYELTKDNTSDAMTKQAYAVLESALNNGINT